jgi:phosphoribosylamine---glycine ligase
MPKKILIVGGGGREHALAWKIAQSPKLGRLYIAPGNGGTREIAENIPIQATDIDGLLAFAEKNAIDLTVVGPDDPLALGIVDAFQARGFKVFGPTKAAAQIEVSKAFAKRLMDSCRIPTASFEVFSRYEETREYVQTHSLPIVIKASGLALGKGAYVCQTLDEAENALREIMVDRVHKDAGNEVVIEEFLAGQEISIHVFSDGKDFVLFPAAQDHKPVLEGDRGKNTGGMGTIAPVPWVNAEVMQVAKERIVLPTLQALTEEGHPFMGLLYPGLKITTAGPKVLEFNARFGDPETQSYMRLLKSDLLDILEACADGKLPEVPVEWHAGYACCIVLASGGYPDTYLKGFPIRGIDDAQKLPGVVIFHAGTNFTNQLLTSGGRVLGVTAVGRTLREALDAAYEAISYIHFESMYFRRDIGKKALQFGRNFN